MYTPFIILALASTRDRGNKIIISFPQAVRLWETVLSQACLSDYREAMAGRHSPVSCDCVRTKYKEDQPSLSDHEAKPGRCLSVLSG